MKINILILLLASFVAFSCKKKNTETKSNQNTPATTSSFFLKKDGVGFTPGYLEISDPFEYAVSIAAAASPQSNANTYSLMINKSIPTGTYDYETLVEDYNCWFSYSAPNFELYSINDGTFEILVQDTVQQLLEMHFQFEMEDPNTGQTYQVTEGKLKAYY